MNNPSAQATQTRRDFLKTAALTGAVVSAPGSGLLADDKPAPSAKMIGTQIGAASFFDEGVEPVLDLLQEKGAVNTIFLNTFSYGRGLAGRQVPGQPFPDHGPQESDEKIFHGGNYATPHAEFYKHTILKDTRAPDYGKQDILECVLPAARKRGLKVYCACEDVWRSSVAGVNKVAEVDLQGRRTGTLCLLNPEVRNFWTGLVTDYCKSYDVEGVLFFNERNGPLLNALGASHSQSIASSRVTCFCDFHRRAAKEMGLDLDRVRQAYTRLDQFVRASLEGRRPSDGYFVEFWRLLVDYPELMAWDKLFDHAKHQIVADINAAVKKVRPTLQVGFHIEHVNSFNPIFRATRSYADLATKADFLKIVVYNNCGGERYVHFIDNVASTVFRDVPKDELMRFNNHLLNYEEKSYGELAAAGLSADYVFRETKRALAGVNGKCKILPGIDIGIPTGRSGRMASQEDTYAATQAGLKAGADGLIFSRKYSEMRLANVAAAGRAVKDF
jgi:TAT (twin-arginine translocation) pathway signal sequence